MAERAVLLIDGPHAGEMIRPPDGYRSWVFADTAPAVSAWPEGDPDPFDGVQHTTYHFHEFPILGQLVCIGWSSLPIALAALAEHLLSAAAKEASR